MTAAEDKKKKDAAAAAKRRRTIATNKTPKTARRKYIKNAGVTAGAIGTAGSAALTQKTGKQGSTASALHWLVGEPKMPINERLSRAGDVLRQNATDPHTYVPLALGVGASIAPKVPIVKIIAKPVDNMIQNLTRGKWRA